MYSIYILKKTTKFYLKGQKRSKSVVRYYMFIDWKIQYCPDVSFLLTWSRDSIQFQQKLQQVIIL